MLSWIDKDGKELKDSYLLIEDENLVRALMKVGTCFKDDIPLTGHTFDLKFGDSVYLLSYHGEGKYMLFRGDK